MCKRQSDSRQSTNTAPPTPNPKRKEFTSEKLEIIENPKGTVELVQLEIENHLRILRKSGTKTGVIEYSGNDMQH